MSKFGFAVSVAVSSPFALSGFQFHGLALSVFSGLLSSVFSFGFLLSLSVGSEAGLFLVRGSCKLFNTSFSKSSII